MEKLLMEKNEALLENLMKECEEFREQTLACCKKAKEADVDAVAIITSLQESINTIEELAAINWSKCLETGQLEKYDNGVSNIDRFLSFCLDGDKVAVELHGINTNYLKEGHRDEFINLVLRGFHLKQIEPLLSASSISKKTIYEFFKLFTSKSLDVANLTKLYAFAKEISEVSNQDYSLELLKLCNNLSLAMSTLIFTALDFLSDGFVSMKHGAFDEQFYRKAYFALFEEEPPCNY